MSKQIRLFLSYAREDSSKVEIIYQKLLEEGFLPWMDSQDLLVGEDWELGIRKAIRSADFFLFFLSSHSVNKRGFLQKELKLAFSVLDELLDNDIYFMPIRLEVCDVPEQIRRFQYLDFFKDKSWQLLLKAVQIETRRRIGKDKESQSKTIDPENFKLAEPGFTRPKAEFKPSESVSSWEVNLRRILNGDLDHNVVRLGGATEYVEALLAESEHSPTTQAAFHEALRNLVQTWDPSKLESENHLSYLLDLIGAYTPATGFGKVLIFSQQALPVNRSAVLEGDESVVDLALKSLLVLEHYHPVSPLWPHNEDGAFKAYVTVLRECLLHRQYRGYAARRLVELSVIDANSSEFGELISKNPEILNELIPLLLSPIRRAGVEDTLTAIYVHCLINGSGLDSQFEEVLSANGATFERLESYPIIHIRTEHIPLRLPAELIQTYFTTSMEQIEKQAGKLLNLYHPVVAH